MNLRRWIVGSGKVGHYRDEQDYQLAAQGEPVLLLSTGRINLAWNSWSPVSLWTAVQGQARVFAQDLRADLDVEGVLVAEHGSRVSCQSAEIRSATLMGLLLPPAWLRALMRRELGEEGGEAPVYPAVLRNDLTLHAMLRRVAELGRCDNGDALAIGCLVEKIALRLIGQQRDLEALVPRCPGRSLRYRRQVLLRLLRARNYIEHSIGGESSLAHLSSLARMSPAHFVRIYHEVFGRTPHRHLMQSRLLVARDMLVRSECAIGDLYLTLGFDNRCAFTRVFKQHFGVPPTRLRAEARARRVALPQPA
jgi:AraC family transcriptional regulator